MTSSCNKTSCRPAPRWCGALLRGLAATETGVVLIMVLVAVLAWATVLEGSRGPETVRSYVYGTWWFAALFVLLAANVAGAVLIRLPLSRSQGPFAITHIGLLVLLCGAAVTLVGGRAGHLTLEVGQNTTHWIDAGTRGRDTRSESTGLPLKTRAVPLGFSLRLLRCERQWNPGGAGLAGFRSVVRLRNPAAGVDRVEAIGPNRPLDYGGFTIYQLDFQQSPAGQDVSVLGIGRDPGRPLKYVGLVVVCLGILGGYLRRKARRGQRPATAVTRLKRGVSGTVVLWLAGLAWTSPVAATQAAEPRPLWGQWRCLSVQEGGRQKPLDTLAREALRTVTGRERVVDPRTRAVLHPVAAYLRLVLEWRGPNGVAEPPADARSAFLEVTYSDAAADDWDRTPLLPVESAELRAVLGLSADTRRVTPCVAQRAVVQVPGSAAAVPLLAWADRRPQSPSQRPSPLEQSLVQLADRLYEYRVHRMGLRMMVVPPLDSPQQDWVSVGRLASWWESRTDVAPPAWYQIARSWEEVRAAWLAREVDRFNRAAAQLTREAAGWGPQWGPYPSPVRMHVEVAYNRLRPRRVAWVLSLAALLLGLSSVFLRARRWLTLASGLALSSALLVILGGLMIRGFLAGRVPVTNMYESVVFVGLGTGLLGLVFARLSGSHWTLVAASASTTLALVLADFCFVVLDPSIRPVPPALRSNFWLAAHVVTVTLSYSAFALAWVIGNLTLAGYWTAARHRAADRALTHLNERLLRVGVLLLAVGTFTGGIWADYSWGRFWGWDPKETWALITLLGYLGLLHARSVQWVGRFGLAALSVICFALVIIAWYGVNFVLGTGLHRYGFGAGGRTYVVAALFLQFVFVAATAARGSTLDDGLPEEPPNERLDASVDVE